MHPGGAIQAPTVGDSLCPGRRDARVFLGAASWQVEKTVPVAKQSVLGKVGVPSNLLFFPGDKVAVTTLQTNIHRWGQKRRQGGAVLLWDSQHSQRQAN